MYEEKGIFNPFAQDIKAMCFTIVEFLTREAFPEIENLDHYLSSFPIKEQYLLILNSWISKDKKKRFKYFTWKYNDISKYKLPLYKTNNKAHIGISDKLYDRKLTTTLSIEREIIELKRLLNM